MNPIKKPGILYAMQNPAGTLVKIGLVEDPSVERLESRWKSLSHHEATLLVRRAIRVPSVRDTEGRIHEVFEPQRRRPGEWFEVKPYQVCAMMYLLSKGKGDRDIADFIDRVKTVVRNERRLDSDEERQWNYLKIVSPPSEVRIAKYADKLSEEDERVFVDIEPVDEQDKDSFAADSDDDSSRRNTPLWLDELGLKSGDVLDHKDDEDVSVTIVTPERQLVEFEGDVMHLTKVTKIIQVRLERTIVTQPFRHWKHEGRLLTELSQAKWDAGFQGRGARTRQTSLTLAQLGLKRGLELSHVKYDASTAVITDPEKQMVEFEGDEITLSEAHKIVQKRLGNSWRIGPYNYWLADGKFLTMLEDEKQPDA